MASSKIQVVIDVNTQKVTFAGGEVKNLRQQAKLLNDELQRTKSGTQEYQLLVEAIGDVEDATRRAKTATQEIYGTLGSLPGPIGDITNNANKMVDTFKTLGTLKTTEIRAQFVNLGKDLKDAGLGFLNLIGFTKRYEANLAQLTGVTTTNTVATEANVLATEAEVVATEAEVIATEADTVAKVTNTAATKTATFWTRALAAAQALLPFAVVAAAAYVLYKGISSLITAYDDAQFSAKKYNDELERQKKLQEDANDVAEFQAEMEKQRARGTENELEKTRRTERAELKRKVTEAVEAEKKLIKDRSEIRKQDISTWRGTENEERTNALKANQTALDEATKARREAEQALLLNLGKNAGDIREKTKQENDKKLQDDKAAGERLSQQQKDQRKKDLAEIEKNERDAYLATLEIRKKETTEVEEKYDKEIALATKYKKDTTTLEAAKQSDLKKLTDKYAEEDKKKAEDKEKLAKDNANKLLDIQKSLNESLLDAMKTGTAKEKAEARKNGDDKIAAFKKQLLEAQELKLLTAEEVALKLAEYVKNVNDAIQNQIEDIDKKDATKKLDDKLKLLQLQSENLLAGTKAYFDSRRAIIDASEQKELEDTELTEEQKTAIKEKYIRQRQQLDKEEFETTLNYISQGFNAAKGVADAILAVNEANQTEELEQAKATTTNKEELAKKQDEINRKYFEKNKGAQKAQAYISTFQGAVQAFTSLSSIPIVGPILGGIAAAAAIVAGLANVRKIEATTYSSTVGTGDSSSGSGSGKAVGTTFAKGGLLDGPSHAQGGIKTSFGELEGGEYVINRNSTASFLPLLTAINSTGNRKYENGGMMANMDTIQAMMATQATPIIKTYVVASDMTSQQEANKRLMDLAKI
jgi:hypothetical protein